MSNSEHTQQVILELLFHKLDSGSTFWCNESKPESILYLLNKGLIKLIPTENGHEHVTITHKGEELIDTLTKTFDSHMMQSDLLPSIYRAVDFINDQYKGIDRKSKGSH